MIMAAQWDAIVVGSGPNGLAAAITLARAGLEVLVVEGRETVGGGLRSAELTLPGFTHDVCSAVHPLGLASPFFSTLPLERFGLKYLFPELDAAHPFDDGTAAVLTRSVKQTAESLGGDGRVYERLIAPVVEDWDRLRPQVLGPLRYPAHPLTLARFGVKALRSARGLARKFATRNARGLWAGMAAHAMQPLENLSTAATALVLLSAGHAAGWPVVEGGSGRLGEALAAYFRSLGGHIRTGTFVGSLAELPPARALLFDLTPRQLLRIAGRQFSALYRKQLIRYRYGPGAFKVDWALSGPVPFSAPACRRAATVHLGGTLEEIARSEQEAWRGRYSDEPFVLLAQPTVVDPSRAPAGRHVAWAYCHVPHGSGRDRTRAVEDQVERFAPGFRDTILATHTLDAVRLEQYNPNDVGGDINGGAMDITQLFTRPALRLSPYGTSIRGVYICSASTPPGGGVHGMCGHYAALRALRDVFHTRVPAPW
jgi:phytoene dehydrogenase-like protein